MTAIVYKFTFQHTAGYSEDLPSLADMCLVLHRNLAELDHEDAKLFKLIDKVLASGNKAKIETIIEAKSLAWSMMGRYGWV